MIFHAFYATLRKRSRAIWTMPEKLNFMLQRFLTVCESGFLFTGMNNLAKISYPSYESGLVFTSMINLAQLSLLWVWSCIPRYEEPNPNPLSQQKICSCIIMYQLFFHGIQLIKAIEGSFTSKFVSCSIDCDAFGRRATGCAYSLLF